MFTNLFIFVMALITVVRGATLSTKHASHLAESFHLSKYTVGFIVVAIISILPETFVAINSAIEGVPSFGLATLFGSNVADLTLIFTIIVLVAGRGIKVESKILKNNAVYPFILLLPIVLGLNGQYSRFEGLALIIAGGAFYYLAFKHGNVNTKIITHHNGRIKSFFWLLISMVALLVGSHFTVTSAINLADYLGISSTLIGMLVVGLGTTMPELFFSLKSVEDNDDSLAVGDLLGTVLADATVVVGLLAFISPFSFPTKIVYLTGMFMVVASFILFYFMRSGRSISKKEAHALFFFWIVFVVSEYIANS